jgi:hypothetical protein
VAAAVAAAAATQSTSGLLVLRSVTTLQALHTHQWNMRQLSTCNAMSSRQQHNRRTHTNLKP